MPPETFKAPTGTRDVLPPESERWQAVIGRFAAAANGAGYGLVLSPMFEELGVFQRVGQSTEIVRKEMYDFEDKGGRHLALRPEGTASVVRAFVQHRPTTPWKVWYTAPSFRYERPQAGRYRQHHQLGAEVLGSDDPDVDVEIITLAWDLFAGIGLQRVILLLNSLGDQQCRPDYLDALGDYLEERRSALCDEHRERVVENPLRILDCKRKACRDATRNAPRTVDHLCDDCTTHFERVQQGLGALGVPFAIETRLVRGLDYYTRTTFEFQATALESAQNAIGGGGRYDRLTEALGGPPTSGIGFGIGIERLLLACDAEEARPPELAGVDVWVIDVAGGEAGRDIATALRRAGIGADRSFDNRSMKAQMKLADRSRARLAVIVGDDELAAGTATVRHLRADKDQETVPRADLVEHLRGLL